MDRELFEAAKKKVIGIDRPREVIGTLGEKSLHAILKHYFEPFSENHEIKLGSFFADIVGEDGIMEIQTKAVYRLKEKLTYFLAVSRVTLVIPVIGQRKLMWIDPESGEVTPGRTTKKGGSLFDALCELGGISDLLTHRNLSVCVVMLDVCDYKLLDGRGERKKLKATKFDRIPENLVEEVYINIPEDYLQLMPVDFPKNFTAADMQKFTKKKSRDCYQAIKAMEAAGLCELAGTRGRSREYKLTDRKI